MPRNIPIQFRRGDSITWENENPVLASGEPGFNSTDNTIKIGDDTTNWNNLPILFSGTYLQNLIEDTTPQLGGDLDLNNNNILGSGNIDITGDITAISGTFNQLIFNTGLDDPNLLAGQIQWNSTEGTLDLGLNENYAMHLGEELLYRVRNTTGSTLLAGQPVYASGLSPGANNRIEAALYAADGTIREIRFMGLITEDLTDNGNNGFATQFGYIRGVDTRGEAATYGTTNKLWASGEPAWNEGDILYVHPSVPGKLTKIEPKHSISVAIITNKASNGKLFVRPTSYGHLDDNHDVDVSGAANGQFLQYNSSTDYWIPSSSGNFTSLLLNDTPVSLVGHTHSASNITDLDSFVSGLLPVKNIVAGSNITISSSSGIYTINSSGGETSSSFIGVRGVISTTGTLTSFAVSGGYPVGYLDLFQDGVKLVSDLDFSATDGSNVTLSNSVPSGTVLEYLTMASGLSAGSSSGLSWSNVPASATATGDVGSIAYDSNYFYIATNTNTWKRSSLTSWPLVSMNYLLVAGGGGGGNGRGGGGGAGGYVYSATSVPVEESISVTVGGGGAGSANSVVAQNGSNSSIALPSETIVAVGGGGGADGLQGLFTGSGMSGASGGSGGGGSGYNPVGSGGSGTVDQGYAGGAGYGGGEPYGGGGGGGAGGVGGSGQIANGGVGKADTILAVVSAGVDVGGTRYVAGGGGGGSYNYTPGSGGSGGGGGGGDTNVDGTNGTANTGGGGGGGGNAANGGSGGSGVVILRCPDAFTATTTGSPETYVTGGYRYYKFTENGTITFSVV